MKKTDHVKEMEKCASNLNNSMKYVFSFYTKREEIMAKWNIYYKQKEKELIRNDN